MENKIVKYIWGPLRALLHSLPVRSQIPVLSVVTGVLCGLAAVLLKVTIRGIHHGLENLVGGANWLYLFLPGVGMLLSFLIVRYIVRDNIGHGVTKVLQAVSKNESKIKRHNMYSSLVTSASPSVSAAPWAPRPRSCTRARPSAPTWAGTWAFPTGG